MQVNIHDAKTYFPPSVYSRKRENVPTAKAGKPIALLTKIVEEAPTRKLGRDAGLFEEPENFDDPVPEDILRL